jgi:hypothetical protein
VPDHPRPAGLEGGARLPGRQQVLDDREELLLRRIPGLEQVVVQRHFVDRRDRGLGVGVGGEQHALGLGHELPRLHEVVRPGEPGHPLVGDEQGDLVAPRAQLAQQLERLGAGGGPQHAEALAEPAAQVAGDRGEHRRLVVHRDDRRAPGRRGRLLAHGPTVVTRPGRLHARRLTVEWRGTLLLEVERAEAAR